LQILGLIPASFSGSNNVNGGLGGVQFGMNKQFDHIVIGGGFRLDGANINGSTGDCAGLTTTVGAPAIVNFNCSTTVNWVATALARVGYAQDRWLAYGTLGWAVAGVDYKSSINILPGIPLVSLPSGTNDTADGFAFGAGLEYAIAESVTLGVDYTRMNLKDNGAGLFLGGIVSSGSREIDLNTVTARLNVKWGG
jgi:opacity protein-like surface antigen